MRRYPLSLAVLLTSACASAPQTPTAPAKGAASVPPMAKSAPVRPKTLVLTGDEQIKRAVWTASGDVVAASRRSIWRMDSSGAVTRSVVESDVTGLAAATKSNVVAVGLAGGIVMLLEGGGKSRLVAVDSKSPVPVVSADGKRIAIAQGESTIFYDAASGANIAAVSGVNPTFDEGGAFLTTTSGGYRAADGSEVARWLETDAAAQGFIGPRAVVFEPEAIAIVDFAKGSTVRMPARCTSRTDVLDVVLKRAIRDCDGKVIVVGVEKLSRSEINVPVPKRVESSGFHELYFERDGAQLVLDWTAEGGEHVRVEVDPDKKSAREIRTEPAYRASSELGAMMSGGAECKPRVESGAEIPASFAWCTAQASPLNRKHLLVNDGGSVAVFDVATGAEKMRWGPVRAVVKAPLKPLVLSARDGGLDIVSSTSTSSEIVSEIVSRIGPPAGKVEPVKVELPKGKSSTCARGKRTMFRRVGERDLFLDAYGPNVCICKAGTCERSRLQPMVNARDFSADRMLGIRRSKALYEQTVWLGDYDGGGEHESNVKANVLGVGFADDGATAVAVTEAAAGAPRELVEMSVPELEIKRRAPIAWHSEAVPRPLSIVSSKTLAVVAEGTPLTHIRALVVRRDGGTTFATLEIEEGYAIVSYDDGAIEIVGEPPARSIVCLEGNVARPFETCRDSVVVSGRFRFD